MKAGVLFGAVVAMLGLLANPWSIAQELVFGVNEGVTYRGTPMETGDRPDEKLLAQMTKWPGI